MLHQPDPPEELGPFEFGVVVLSLVLLLGLSAELAFDVPAEIQKLIFYIDTAVCGLLFLDFCIRFGHAKSKLKFMKLGWLDLLACVPAVEALRWLRIVRVVRFLYAIRSAKRLFHILWESKTSAGLTGVLVITFLFISFGSTGVLMAEIDHPDANIHSAEDALWWALVTTTTVGYGDFYPITTAGRIIATFLMIAGIGLFGTLSGVAAGIFLGDKKAEPASGENQLAMLDRLEAMQKEIHDLHERTAGLDRGDAGKSKS